jgi:hypothetical protein
MEFIRMHTQTGLMGFCFVSPGWCIGTMGEMNIEVIMWPRWSTSLMLLPFRVCFGCYTSFYVLRNEPGPSIGHGLKDIRNEPWVESIEKNAEEDVNKENAGAFVW